MSEPRYIVILDGKPLPAVSRETLAANLAELFKISLEEAQRLVRRGEVSIKRNLSEHEAERYLAALHKAGAPPRTRKRSWPCLAMRRWNSSFLRARKHA